MSSLDVTAQHIREGLLAGWPDQDLVRLLAEAVHDFECIDQTDERWQFLEEPRLTGDVAWDAAIAALAVHLCRMAHFDRTPDWTRTPERYSPTFRWIGLPPGSELKAYVFQRTPIYFKARGVMLNSANLVSV